MGHCLRCKGVNGNILPGVFQFGRICFANRLRFVLNLVLDLELGLVFDLDNLRGFDACVTELCVFLSINADW